ncbi:MAG: DUF4062 domain-containing protein [Nitrospirae bacterium]|nr:DUF4062 domain-containing protein [Nitrospirota bacterium]MBF0534311.1 DUF4062 domain-containing protein [Nitrospirota bacterium]MBF0615708.1 DUF4062 domain-containing protein [Nitrospirota bacterium]
MSTKKHDLSVYISSTSNDLKRYRAELIDALEKMETRLVCMEKYVAASKSPIEQCLEDVSNCDIYVGIFGRCYGDIPEGYYKSFTELEYRKAIDLKIPTLIFTLDENVCLPDEYCGDAQDESRINELRSKLKLVTTCNFFTDPQDLAIKVMTAVGKYQRPPDGQQKEEQGL